MTRRRRFLYSALLGLCPILVGQPRPDVEHGGKACWFIDLPAWKQPAGWEKPEPGLMELEFRQNPAVEGVILLGLRLLPRNGLKNRSTSTYGENRYWISMKGKQRTRLATPEEWNAAKEIPDYHGHCSECRQADNHAVLFGAWRFVPSHSDQYTWVWVRPNESPDRKWLLLDSWFGQQFRTGSDWFTGGSMGARGHSYFDLFNLQTGKRALTFGGFRENTKSDVTGFFLGTQHQPFWLAPHYLVGDLTEKNRSFLFCNPDLAEAVK